MLELFKMLIKGQKFAMHINEYKNWKMRYLQIRCTANLINIQVYLTQSKKLIIILEVNNKIPKKI